MSTTVTMATTRRPAAKACQKAHRVSDAAAAVAAVAGLAAPVGVATVKAAANRMAT
jgi:hypothetical protein